MPNVLVLGSGGREHAIARVLFRDHNVEEVHVCPGNPGMERDNLICHPGDVSDFPAIAQLLLHLGCDMLVVGPEAPLVGGLVDFLHAQPGLEQLPIVGPDAAGARLEGSKAFAKAFMEKYKIPTASYRVFHAEQAAEALAYIDTVAPPYVVKADGLAAGKGVAICATREEAAATLQGYFAGRFGEAGTTLLIEQFLEGIELSVFVLTDGDHAVVFPEAKDYKRVGDHDQGANTGGMGSVSPVPFLHDDLREKILDRIVFPTLQGLREERIRYCGWIFFGLMCTPAGDPYLIEYNVRLGDPEAQVLLPRVDESLYTLLRQATRGELIDRYARAVPDSFVSVTLAAQGYPSHPQKGASIAFLPTPPHAALIYSGVSGRPDALVTAGGRVMSAVGRGPTLYTAVTRAYQAASSVVFEGKNYRHDIAQDLLYKR